MVQPIPVTPSDPLSINLKILAQNPYDVNALTQAGVGALQVGDPQAAIGFLARAEELSPRDGRIKAALGTALTMVERPDEALRTFGEALSLGVFEREIAKDRGLAHDLRGDHKKAQKDYALAAKVGADPEVTQRYALSLGISGDKDDALKMLDPLVRRGDQGAWRARAFVLAMNGDMPQADRIIRAATPPSMAGSMSAFLRRLPSLTPAQRASAVNFGTIPTTGPSYAALEPSEPFRSIGNGSSDGLLTASPDAVRMTTSSSSSLPAAQPKPSRSELRRIAKQEKELANLAAKGAKASGSTPAVTTALPQSMPARPTQTAALGQRVGARIGPVDPSRLPPELRVPTDPGAVTQTRAVLVQGAKDLPAPDGVRAPVSATMPTLPPSVATAPVVSQPVSAPVIAPLPPSPTLPTPQTVTAPKPPETPPVQIAVATPAPSTQTPPAAGFPAVTPPVVTPPTVAVTVLAPAPAPAVLTPAAPAPTAIPLPPPLPTPAPVTPSVSTVDLPPSQVAAPPSAVATIPLAATPALMGPPAPDNLQPSFTTPPAPVAQVDQPQPGFTGPEPAQTPTISATSGPAEEPANRLAAILQGVEPEAESAAAPLPTAAEIRAARLANQRKLDLDAKAKLAKEAEATAAKEKAAEDAAKLKANPARTWVQIATGANKAGLPVTWRKLKTQAPKALGDRSAWFVAFRSTNRLLVGPVKSTGEARTLVTALGKEGVQANGYSSEAGLEVTRLGGK